jgi:formate-dependent nitrite reductase membrane component NrfD
MIQALPFLGRLFGRSRRDEAVVADATGEIIAGIAYVHPSKLVWWLGFLASGGLLAILGVSLSLLFERGIIIWGNDDQVVWALDIVSYDWWMGLACGCLLVSAVLLHRVRRGSLSRVADTAAVLCAIAAAIYPIIHLGRPWFFYWNMAYPNVMGLWPQFRSPLFWDETDIVGFLTISLVFWFTGLIPDFAVLRDRAPLLLKKQLYGIASLGWRGDAAHWMRWRVMYRILAVLAALIAINVQWGASMMYAVSLEPGWHDTLLPLETIIDAALGGAGLIAVLTGIIRAIYPLGTLIREDELDALGRALLTLGILAAYCYAAEFFFTYFGGDSFERAGMVRRVSGPTAWAFWMVVGCALVPVHLLWFREARRSAALLVLIGLLVMAGLWANNFMDLVGTLQYDYLPSSMHRFSATIWSVSTWLGSMGLFLAPFMLFLRYLPVVSIHEARPARSVLQPMPPLPVAVTEPVNGPVNGIVNGPVNV